MLNAHPNVGTECLYLETGKIPLRYSIMQRRLLYLWHILHWKKTELVVRVYFSQKLTPKRGDWVKSVENNKNQLGIDLSDDKISNISKEMFKNIVGKKVKTLALTELNNLKEKHSKSGRIQSKKFQTAQYMVEPSLNKKEQQLLFGLRTKTVNLKINFNHRHKDHLCLTCNLLPETQAHVLQCPEIVKHMKHIIKQDSKWTEDDIYCKLEDQIRIVKIYSEVLEIRNKLTEMMN